MDVRAYQDAVRQALDDHMTHSMMNFSQQAKTLNERFIQMTKNIKSVSTAAKDAQKVLSGMSEAMKNQFSNAIKGAKDYASALKMVTTHARDAAKAGTDQAKSGAGRKSRRGNKNSERSGHEEEKKSDDDGESGLEKAKKLYEVFSQINATGLAYQKLLEGLRARGLDDAQLSQANDFVYTNNIPDTSRLDRMSILADAQNTFNADGLGKQKSLQAAEVMMPVLARYDVASKMLDDAYDPLKDPNRGVINKLVESMGALNDPKRASEIADGVFKYTQGTHQTIDQKKFEAFVSSNSPATRRQNIASLFGVIEPVIDDMGGDAAASGMQKAANHINGKMASVPKNLRQELARLDIANASGNGQTQTLSDLQSSDIARYTQKLMAIYAAHGINSAADRQLENSLLFGSSGAKVYDKIMESALKTQPGYNSVTGIASVLDSPRSRVLMAKDQVAKKYQDMQLTIADKGKVTDIFAKGEDILSGAMAIGTNFMDKHPLLASIGTDATLAYGALSGLKGGWSMLKKAAGALGNPLKLLEKVGGRAALTTAAEAIPEAVAMIGGWPVIAAGAAVAATGYGGYQLYKHFNQDSPAGEPLNAVASKGAADFNVSNPDAAAQYRHLINPGQYPAVPPAFSSAAPQPVNLLLTHEGRQVLIATVIGGISKEASKPRSGVSGFDPSQLFLPPGSVSKLATN